MIEWKQLNIQSQLLENLNKYNWQKPTKVQSLVISKINRNCDILIQSHTGSGKTGAFLIPIINRLSYIKQTIYNPLVLILSPTRELAQQTQQVFQNLSENMNLQSILLTGGIPLEKQLRSLQNQPQVLIATPGRVADLLSNGQLYLDQIQILVIDEADKLIQLNYVSEIHAIVQQLPFKKQTIFASATLNEEALKLSEFVLVKPIRVNLEDGVIANQNIDQQWVLINNKEEKLASLSAILKQNLQNKIVIFVTSKITLQRLQSELNIIFDNQLAFYILSSQYSQQQRNETVELFNREKQAILLSTDLGSRGIDFKNVQYVINYEITKEPEQYIHRIGRSARFENKGTSITICERKEAKQLIQQLQKIGQLGTLNERVISQQLLAEYLKIIQNNNFRNQVKEEQERIQTQRQIDITDKLLDRHDKKLDKITTYNNQYVIDQNQKKAVQQVIRQAHQGQLTQKEAAQLLKQKDIKNSLKKLRNNDEKKQRNNKNTQVSKEQKQKIRQLKKQNKQKKIEEI